MSVASPAKTPKGDSQFNVWLITAKLTSDLFQEYPAVFNFALCLIISGLLEGVSLIACSSCGAIFDADSAFIWRVTYASGLVRKLGIEYSFHIFILIFLGAVILKSGLSLQVEAFWITL